MQHRRTAVALAVGIVLGFGLALTQGVIASRPASPADLPPRDLRLIAEVLGRVKADYVDVVDDHQLMGKALRGMVSGLDPHSAFLDSEEYEELRVATQGNYSGIGIEVSLEDGFVVVVAPFEGSPAERAGIQAGDAIIAIDGKVLDTTSLADALARMRGEPGTPVRVTIEREDVEEPITYAMQRAAVLVHSVRAELLAPGEGYLRISQFSETTGSEVEAAIAKLKARGPLKGLVLDLRNNPGGVLEAGIEVADAFLERGVIVSADGRTDESRFSVDAEPGDLLGGAPIVVLVNGGSASASEIVAGALRDHHRATLVGRTTFGKGTVQTVLPLSDGQALKLTTSRYYTPSGASIQGKGLRPDLELPRRVVPPATDDKRPLLERDAEVLAALDALRAPAAGRR
ncbi:MAG: S41 family peptidase [Steroidobacteraceae bacterium]|nr:S41 family peptidase [Steroidobacteraceae bacterium]MCC7198275.1 S41 family peptidase [Gammaproteobacteria bacterium]